MASNIQRPLKTSQKLFRRFLNINCPKSFLTVRQVDPTVAVAARAKVFATAAASTICIERYTVIITKIIRA